MSNKKQKFEIIDDSGNVSKHTNGAIGRSIIFRKDLQKFKISIHSESYEFQSYARLYKWTDNSGFEIVISKNPKRDYNINCAYQRTVDKTVFDPIVKELRNIAEKTFL